MKSPTAVRNGRGKAWTSARTAIARIAVERSHRASLSRQDLLWTPGRAGVRSAENSRRLGEARDSDSDGADAIRDPGHSQASSRSVCCCAQRTSPELSRATVLQLKTLAALPSTVANLNGHLGRCHRFSSQDPP
ncbi:hypothetical protein LIA77_03935 [Sarocladium implicatum]|nr:hypothetical protein LIA77_03935 [Sarocladium implicatum]